MSRNVRRVAIVLALLSGFLGASGNAAGQERSAEFRAAVDEIEVTEQDGELARLFKDRHNAAAALSQLRVREYQVGRGLIESVLLAHQQLCSSKLEIAATQAEHVATHERMVELARQLETAVSARVAVGLGSAGDSVQARYARLDAEVRLLQAREKAGKPPQDTR